jgi:tetratricopeptide (TPR) repeat protein
MLLDAGAHERLRERGRFWHARHARDRDHDYSDLIGHIRDLVSDPEGATFKLASRDAPKLLDLRRALATLPALECRYTLNRGDGEAQLAASGRLVEIEAEWRRHAEVDKPDLVMLQSGDSTAPSRVAPGIAWLAGHPEAWQSFEILDDLTLAVREAELMSGGAILLEPLLERACALLRLALEHNAAGGCKLPWVFLGNRPALRLAASLCYLRLDQKRFDDAEAIARWLVLELNPNDDHGLRAELTRLALRRGDARAALDVCDRYPDDGMIDTVFNRVLARFMLGNRDEATSALRAAAKSHPRIVPMLLAPSRKRPRDGGTYVAYGSAQEAWIYRDESRSLWEQAGALDWAREAVRSRR